VTIERNWTEANEYRHLHEGRCVVCGRPDAELAHIIGREHDTQPPINWTMGWDPKAPLVVVERVILLCGPATTSSTCHGIYDGPASGRARLNLLPRLDVARQAQAVADAGGIVPALRRITGVTEAVDVPYPMRAAELRPLP